MDEIQVFPTPDPDFCRRLNEFDQGLELNWDHVHKRWSIWYRNASTGERSHVMNVIEPDGSFRPLDERTFQILRMNRFYAENPDIACEKIITVDKDQEREKKFVHDEMRHLSRDKTLNRKWKELVEKARSISWKEWKRSRPLHDKNGNVLKNKDGKPIMFKPHDSLKNSKGPSI